jgi:hypothetical protein
MAIEQDVPPSDLEVLTVIRTSQEGISPSALLQALCDQGHSRDNTIKAIQRVFDRGLVDLVDGAKLVESKDDTQAAA